MRASHIVVTRDIPRFEIVTGDTAIVRRLIGERGVIQAVRQRDGRPFIAPVGSWRFARGSTAVLPGGVHGHVLHGIGALFDDLSLTHYSVAAGETDERQDVPHDDLTPVAYGEPRLGDVVHFLADAHYLRDGQRRRCWDADTLLQFSGFVARRHPDDGDYLVAIDSPHGADRTWVWADSRSLLVADRLVEGEQATLAPGTEVVVRETDHFWIDTDGHRHPPFASIAPYSDATVEAESHITGNVVVSINGMAAVLHRTCLEVTTVATTPQPIDPQRTDTMTTTPENATTEQPLPTRTDSIERLRTMVVNFYNEGLRHGYLNALTGFEEWFEETAGVNAARFAGTPYQVQGEYEVRGTFNGHNRRLAVPYGQGAYDPVWTLAAVEGTRIASATALYQIARKDYDRAPLTDGRVDVSVDVGRFTFTPVPAERAYLPDHIGPVTLMDEVLSWVGRRAEEESWCSEYEAFCRKNGYEPRRGGSVNREREVTVQVEVEYETDYDSSSQTQDGALLDTFVGSDHAPSLNSFSLTMTYTVEMGMQITLPADVTDAGEVTVSVEDVEAWLENQNLPFTRVLEAEVIDLLL